jgi:peptidoglycan/xylan/chitin deacetylase (PgdA/CDA1 family)
MRAAHLGRDLVLLGAHRLGASRLYARLWGARRVVLTYHNVLPARAIDGGYTFRVDTDADTFDRQIAFLRRNFRVLPATALEGDDEGLVLTFDDGMRNAYTVIAPILERHGVTGVFAVCPGLVDGDVAHLWREHVYLLLLQRVGGTIRLPMDGYRDELAVDTAAVNRLGEELKSWVLRERVEDVYAMVREICARNGVEYRRMGVLPDRFHPATWEMLRELEGRGHRVVSHTWSHRILKLLPPAAREMELRRSREVLEARLGHPVDCIVYPFGSAAEVDRATMELAMRCGYRCGFMNVRRPEDAPARMGLPRSALPPTASRSHLHASVSGFKDALLRR